MTQTLGRKRSRPPWTRTTHQLFHADPRQRFPTDFDTCLGIEIIDILAPQELVDSPTAFPEGHQLTPFLLLNPFQPRDIPTTPSTRKTLHADIVGIGIAVRVGLDARATRQEAVPDVGVAKGALDVEFLGDFFHVGALCVKVVWGDEFVDEEVIVQAEETHEHVCAGGGGEKVVGLVAREVEQRLVHDRLVFVHFFAAGEAVGWQCFADGEFEGVHRGAIPCCFDGHSTVIVDLMRCQWRDDDEVSYALFHNVDCPWERFEIFDRGEQVFRVDVVAQRIPVIGHAFPVPG